MALGAALDALQHGSILLGPVASASQPGQSGNAFEHWWVQFNADTDGYVREEGGSSLVPRSALGVFIALGSLQTVATNHDGGTASFTVPSQVSTPAYAEADGTGTP